MQFEVIRKSHKKEIVLGIGIFVILTIVLVVRFTFAKYELVKSIKIAEGTINYKVPDFKIMAMYKNDGNGDTPIDTMPESGYAINEEKSYCTLDNINKDTKVKLYTNDRGKHIFENMTKSEKCYLYFNKINTSNITTVLGDLSLNLNTPDFSKNSCLDGSNIDGSNCLDSLNGLFKAQDDDGDTYYFRGVVNNNYVRFANKVWRIIRINGDGTIRIIYDRNATALYFNGAYQDYELNQQCFSVNCKVDNAAYIGFKYTLGEAHGLSTKSNALEVLETWYKKNLVSYASKIDTNAGFCGDRSAYLDEAGTTTGSGVGATTFYYGAWTRFSGETETPTFKCNNSSDLYTTSLSSKGNKTLTYPIGLVTADEGIYAGFVFNPKNVKDAFNKGNYLYSGQDYWTMTPAFFHLGKVARQFGFQSAGSLANSTLASSSFDLRPVINLRSDITFTFKETGEKGSIDNPYVVS